MKYEDIGMHQGLGDMRPGRNCCISSDGVCHLGVLGVWCFSINCVLGFYRLAALSIFLKSQDCEKICRHPNQLADKSHTSTCIFLRQPIHGLNRFPSIFRAATFMTSWSIFASISIYFHHQLHGITRHLHVFTIFRPQPPQPSVLGCHGALRILHFCVLCVSQLGEFLGLLGIQYIVI